MTTAIFFLSFGGAASVMVVFEESTLVMTLSQRLGGQLLKDQVGHVSRGAVRSVGIMERAQACSKPVRVNSVKASMWFALF
jgi:hypothetical protein